MGDLLEHVASQQSLIDAWDEIRDRTYREGRNDEAILAFEHRAARRLAEMSDELRAGRWRPSLVHPVTVPKPDGGVRTLAISTTEDRIVETAILGVVDRLIDPELQPWSFAYRRGLGVSDALRALCDARDEGAVWVARGDFSRCFDEIPRARVLASLERLVADGALLELVRLLVYRPVEGADGSTPVGLHQGSALSPMLANLYLDAFDRAMLDADLVVLRYGDDFAIPVATQREAEAALARASLEAASLQLDLSPAKCGVRSFEEGVPFLGETISTATGARGDRTTHPRSITVYVTEEGALLRSRGNRLRVEKAGELLYGIAFERVRQVVVFGRVGLTTPLLQRALELGIDVVFLSDYGRYFGRLQGPTGTNPFLRQRQYLAAADGDIARDLARRIVAGKLVNLRGGLLRARRRGDDDMAVDLAIGRIEALRAHAQTAVSVASLLGVEGSATREYFGGFASMLEPTWSFSGRHRRPPPDPVNSALSLGYSLLSQEAVAALETAGLDPYSGFLHGLRLGRPSLAFDLMEEFRPVIVDSVVIRALHTGMLVSDDFVTDTGPPATCLLTNVGRRKFLAAYERRMLTAVTHPQAGRRVSYRVALSYQARAIASEILGVGRYEPLVWK